MKIANDRYLYGTNATDAAPDGRYIEERHAASETAVVVAVIVLAGRRRGGFTATHGVGVRTDVNGVCRMVTHACLARSERRQHRRGGDTKRQQIAEQRRRDPSKHGVNYIR